MGTQGFDYKIWFWGGRSSSAQRCARGKKTPSCHSGGVRNHARCGDTDAGRTAARGRDHPPSGARPRVTGKTLRATKYCRSQRSQTAGIDRPDRPRSRTALTMLAKAQYESAAPALRLCRSVPNENWRPSGVWVGDIAFVQKDYPKAARGLRRRVEKVPGGQSAVLPTHDEARANRCSRGTRRQER